jgi:CheY-like chemotaxis protein
MTAEPALQILLVEDDRHDLATARHALLRHHLVNDVRVVHDGDAAIAVLQDDASTARVVLLDLDLPGTPGVEVVRRLRADTRLRGVPIVVLTTSRHEPALQECYRLGVSTFIVKPLDFVQFATAMRELAFRWRLLPPQPP